MFSKYQYKSEKFTICKNGCGTKSFAWTLYCINLEMSEYVSFFFAKSKSQYYGLTWNQNVELISKVVVAVVFFIAKLDIHKENACVKRAIFLHKDVFKNEMLQSVTKYLTLTLVFMWNSAPREKFNGYFLGLVC